MTRTIRMVMAMMMVMVVVVGRTSDALSSSSSSFFLRRQVHLTGTRALPLHATISLLCRFFCLSPQRSSSSRMGTAMWVGCQWRRRDDR